MKTDIYNLHYKHNKTDILKLIYTNCSQIGTLNICLPSERINTNLGIYDKLVLYTPNEENILNYNRITNSSEKLTEIIFNFLQDFKQYNTKDVLTNTTGDSTLICENNKKFLFKKNISSTGKGIYILEQCNPEDDLRKKSREISDNLLRYEGIKGIDTTIESFKEQLLNDYFFLQSFYETPFKYLSKISGVDKMINIRCKLRFFWSPIVIKYNDNLYNGCVIYNIPDIEFHHTLKLISNSSDTIDDKISADIKGKINDFILSKTGQHNLSNLSKLFTKLIDDKYKTITEQDTNKNYVLSKINGADFMPLGNDNYIDSLAFLENNTGPVLLGTTDYSSTYLDCHINNLCTIVNDMKNPLSSMRTILLEKNEFELNQLTYNHYIYITKVI